MKKADDFIEASPIARTINEIDTSKPSRSERFFAEASYYPLRETQPKFCRSLKDLAYLATSRDIRRRPRYNYAPITSLSLDIMEYKRNHLQRAFIGCRLETKYYDIQILRAWFLTIYMGEGEFGIENAANTLFGKKFAELNYDEILHLIAVSNSTRLRQKPELLTKRVNYLRARINWEDWP